MNKRVVSGVVSLFVLSGCLSVQGGAESGNTGRWHIGVAGGYVDLEGDEPLKDGAVGALSVGYGLSRRWTIEGVLEVCPELKSSYRTDWETGERISRLSEAAGRELAETSATRLSVDLLLQLAPDARVAPYLAAGLGVAVYENDFDRRVEPVTRVGAGFFVNLDPNWALRFDGRVAITGEDSEFNLIATAGLVFRLGDRRGGSLASVLAPSAVALDTAGPVAEPVVEAAPVVRLFVLNLNFEPGASDIKAEYRSELDVIGRLLDTRPGATARIEGHAQPGAVADEGEARVLSEKRAGAVRDYLAANWAIRPSRMQADGFGTSRPGGDPALSGERIEVYVTLP